MKKHNNDLLYAEANQRQRFSIRKLSIGAASVLLGTVFYLGGNASVTHAEESVGSQQAQTQVEEEAQKPETSTSEIKNGGGTSIIPCFY